MPDRKIESVNPDSVRDQRQHQRADRARHFGAGPLDYVVRRAPLGNTGRKAVSWTDDGELLRPRTAGGEVMYSLGELCADQISQDSLGVFLVANQGDLCREPIRPAGYVRANVVYQHLGLLLDPRGWSGLPEDAHELVLRDLDAMGQNDHLPDALPYRGLDQLCVHEVVGIDLSQDGLDLLDGSLCLLVG